MKKYKKYFSVNVFLAHLKMYSTRMTLMKSFKEYSKPVLYDYRHIFYGGKIKSGQIKGVSGMFTFQSCLVGPFSQVIPLSHLLL